jgi:hypothetical protein
MLEVLEVVDRDERPIFTVVHGTFFFIRFVISEASVQPIMLPASMTSGAISPRAPKRLDAISDLLSFSPSPL